LLEAAVPRGFEPLRLAAIGTASAVLEVDGAFVEAKTLRIVGAHDGGCFRERC
jgi:hypothetical protein